MGASLSPPFISDLPLTCEALQFAVAHHEGQRRESDAAPFILHPLEVAVLLRNRGYDDEVVAAGLLHDAIEDTDATVEDLREHFGPRVCELVRALSDDASIEGYAKRKAALREQVARSGPEAAAIFAADKVAKVRELRARLTRDPRALDDPVLRQRLEHYEASLAMLDERLPEHPLPRQLRFELWALRTLPPS
ncbi:MAG TPA: HD domain-containing protein [Solirubrobacteraceae bacterium]|nr:HD domain-containing protein [Solirubrobacteraceae bacterium]